MKQAFIIMQIGNPDMDSVCKEAVIPALSACNLTPKRVDKHNEGKLLKSEIVRFIETSDIIIADLTNERPNCYLEVGYAMGLDKFRNLILTAREDHNPESPHYKSGGHKIHFDLAGYDILFWDPDKLSAFRSELERRVRRRIATLPDSPKKEDASSALDVIWFQKHKEMAKAALKEGEFPGHMEVEIAIIDSQINVPQNELLRAAEQSEIHTFGWPIGVILHRDGCQPRPTTDGIIATIKLDDLYDYWAIKKDGAFYLMKSLFEDSRKSGHVFFNTRIVRVTEVLLHTVRLYRALNVDFNSTIWIQITHSGLRNRILSASGSRYLSLNRKSTEDEVSTDVKIRLGEIESRLVELVDTFISPLFMLFEFHKIDKSIVESIVNKFVAGEVT